MVCADHKEAYSKKLSPRKEIRAPVKRLTKNSKLESTESQCNSPWLMQLHLKLHFILMTLDL